MKARLRKKRFMRNYRREGWPRDYIEGKGLHWGFSAKGYSRVIVGPMVQAMWESASTHIECDLM